MTIVADSYWFVTGVDTHSKKHQYALVDRTGRLVDERAFPTSAAGIARATHWLTAATGGQPMLAAIDGAGSYGRQLAEAFTGAGVRVVEAPQIRYRPAGKDDRLDARTAAITVLPLDTDRLSDRKAGAERDAIQVLLTARAEMTRDRTRTLNALTAILRRFDLGIDARNALTSARLKTITAWRTRPTEPVDTATAHAEAVRLATRARALTTELAGGTRPPSAPSLPSWCRSFSPSPASGRSARRRFTRPGPTPAASAPKPRSPDSPASPRNPPPAETVSATASTAAATDALTPRSTAS